MVLFFECPSVHSCQFKCTICCTTWESTFIYTITFSTRCFFYKNCTITLLSTTSFCYFSFGECLYTCICLKTWINSFSTCKNTSMVLFFECPSVHSCQFKCTICCTTWESTCICTITFSTRCFFYKNCMITLLSTTSSCNFSFGECLYTCICLKTCFKKFSFFKNTTMVLFFECPSVRSCQFKCTICCSPICEST